MLLAPALVLLEGCADLLGVQALSGDAGTVGCDAIWVDAGVGGVPPGAVPNGPLDASFVDYVCRVWSGSAAIPGKLLSTWYCYYGDGTGEVHSSDYEVLVPAGCTVDWAPATPSGVPPPWIFQSGQDSQGLPLYSCRVEHEGGGGSGDLGHMGMSTNHACVYSNAQQSLSSTTYDVLTVH
jgi:hypothetical protein